MSSHIASSGSRLGSSTSGISGGTSSSRSRRVERLKRTGVTNTAVPAAQRYQTAPKQSSLSAADPSVTKSVSGGSNSHLGGSGSIGSGGGGGGTIAGGGGGGGSNNNNKEMSASFSHKVAYWTKKMGISSNSHGGNGQPRPEQMQYPPHGQQQQAQQYPPSASAGQPYNKHGRQPLQQQQQQQQYAHRHQPQKGSNPYRSTGTSSRTVGGATGAANSLADAMDESDDLLYQSATQGIQKMNVDSRDESDHHTTTTASTAAATHSYSIDDGSTGVSENGTEIVMPPRTIGMANSGDAAQYTPYNAHSFKAGNQTFTVDTKYSLIRVIGSGAYGVVISALDSSAQSKVAIKMVPRAFHDEVDAKRILREIKLLKHFHHENIVGITDMMPPLARHVEDFNDVYICNELMETDLHRIIYSKQPLTIDHVQYFLYQLLRALKYIHSANVLHRDLKPSNLLVNSNCDLKICDFGLARGVLSDEEMAAQRKSNLLTEYVVTRWYRAPEIMLACHEYAKPVDVWSAGCIFAELLGRKPYFPGDDYIDQVSFRRVCVLLNVPRHHVEGGILFLPPPPALRSSK